MNNAYLIFLSHQKFSIKSMPKIYTNQESSAYDDGNGYSHANREIKKSEFIYTSFHQSIQTAIHPFLLKSVYLSFWLPIYSRFHEVFAWRNLRFFFFFLSNDSINVCWELNQCQELSQVEEYRHRQDNLDKHTESILVGKLLHNNFLLCWYNWNKGKLHCTSRPGLHLENIPLATLRGKGWRKQSEYYKGKFRKFLWSWHPFPIKFHYWYAGLKTKMVLISY